MNIQNIFGFMILYFIIGTIFTYLVYRFIYYKSKQVENKYFLYKVRDELVLLVARGKLDERDFLFQTYYPLVNNLIDKINTFRFSQIIKVLSKTEDFIKASEFTKKVDEELRKQPKEVRKVFNNFYESIGTILYRNSLLFRLLFKLIVTFTFLSDFFEKHKNMFAIFDNQLKALNYSFYIQRRIR